MREEGHDLSVGESPSYALRHFVTGVKEPFAKHRGRRGDRRHDVPVAEREEGEKPLAEALPAVPRQGDARSVFHRSNEIARASRILPQVPNPFWKGWEQDACRTEGFGDPLVQRDRIIADFASFPVEAEFRRRAPRAERTPPERSRTHNALKRKEHLKGSREPGGEGKGHGIGGDRRTYGEVSDPFDK